jgi:hypothetical protein
VGDPERKRQLGRPRRRCVDNIKMDLREREDGVMWTGSIWLRIETSGSCGHCDEPSSSIKYWEVLE